MLIKTLKKYARLTLPIILFASPLASATVVEIQTSQGDFQINLHDQTTPKTVENFLTYINAGDYDNSVVHRVVPSFVMQAGGYKFEGNFPLVKLETNDSVNNEPVYSNVRGTIAMAKLPNNADSATSQWFINYTDNSANLDVTNGGYTVFGEVIGDGMEVVDLISTFHLCSEIPMPEYSAQLCSDNAHVPGVDNFITIYQVIIIDSSETTSDSLTPVKNTLIDATIPPTTPIGGDTGSSGGSTSLILILLSSIIAIRRKF